MTVTDLVFDLCVRVLVWLADALGISYKAVNVLVFCVVWPAITLLLVVKLCMQHRRIRQLRRIILQMRP